MLVKRKATPQQLTVLLLNSPVANMRAEKQGSRGIGSRYVGGFVHLFDWNATSSKKSPNLSEEQKQKGSSNTNVQFHPVIEDYTPMLQGCADEDDYGKTPGVVARLMGLNSLPNSNLSVAPSNRFFESRSKHLSCARKSPQLDKKDYHQMERKHIVIDKFQIESLPVPITQRPARIMEAASKIPLVRSSTLIPFSTKNSSRSNGRSMISDQGPPRRRVESNAARNLKGQSMSKSWDGCLNPKPFLEKGNKSVSLAVQAKVNVKKRQGVTLNGKRSLHGADNMQKNTLRKPTKSVLKQNNQKHNGLLLQGRSAAKSLATPTNSQYQKPVLQKSSKNIFFNPTNKTVNQRKNFLEDVKSKVHDKKNASGSVVKSNGLDVVSFTFTSPILRSAEKKLADNHGKNDFDGNMTSTTGVNYRARISRTPIFQDGISKDDLLCRFASNYHQVAEATLEYSKLAGDRDPSIISLTGPCFIVESCSYTTNICGNDVLSRIEQRSNSESGYVTDILCDIECMFESFSIGRTEKIVNPSLFDQVEADEPRLRRKLLFDCVSECVEWRCRVWQRGVAAVRRKDELAKQVCKQISGWEQMKDCMVDELVDKDMSSNGKWLDFDVEAFELGVEIQRRLLASLINEAVDDTLLWY